MLKFGPYAIRAHTLRALSVSSRLTLLTHDHHFYLNDYNLKTVLSQVFCPFAVKKIKKVLKSKENVYIMYKYHCILDRIMLHGGDFTVTDKTMTFRITNDNEDVMRDTLTQVFDALQEKGYNPINQIVGYILSEDPTYITTHKNARSLIRRLDRDELLAEMVKSYLS